MVRPLNVDINHVNITVWFLVKISMAQPKELLSTAPVDRYSNIILDPDFMKFIRKKSVGN
jgi:hypothetical protein